MDQDQDNDRERIVGEAANLRLDLCPDLRRPTRISFSPGAKPPDGTGVRQTHRTRPRRRPRLAHFEDEDDGVSEEEKSALNPEP